MIGFNIGNNLSLGDIDLAIEYLANNGEMKEKKPVLPWEPKIAEIIETKSVEIDKEEELKKQFAELKRQRIEKIELEIAQEKERLEEDREKAKKEAEEAKRRLIEEKEKLRLEELKKEERRREEELQKEEDQKINELKRLREQREKEAKLIEESKRAVAFNVDDLEMPELGIEKTKVVSEPRVNKKDHYKSMDIEALYVEVKRFMKEQGVERAVIDKTVLEYEFGADNIKKLIVKSYLIPVRRGVTAGR